jgi:hypothetical protein
MVEKRNKYRILLGKPEGKCTLGRPRNNWVDNIKIDIRKAGWDDMDWKQWMALVNTLMNLRDPFGFLSSCTTGGFSTRAQLHEVSY